MLVHPNAPVFAANQDYYRQTILSTFLLYVNDRVAGTGYLKTCARGENLYDNGFLHPARMGERVQDELGRADPFD